MDTSLERFMSEHLGMRNDRGESHDETGSLPRNGADAMGDHASQPHPQADDFRFLAGEEIATWLLRALQADGGVSAWYQQLCMATVSPWRNDCHDPTH